MSREVETMYPAIRRHKEMVRVYRELNWPDSAIREKLCADVDARGARPGYPTPEQDVLYRAVGQALDEPRPTETLADRINAFVADVERREALAVVAECCSVVVVCLAGTARIEDGGAA